MESTASLGGDTTHSQLSKGHVDEEFENNRGIYEHEDCRGNHSLRPSEPTHENEKRTEPESPLQSNQDHHPGRGHMESCFVSSGKQSTQARTSNCFHPPVCSHAVHDQGGLEAAHHGDGRGTSGRVDSHSTRARAERRDFARPEDPEPTPGGNEQGFQEESRPAKVHPELTITGNETVARLQTMGHQKTRWAMANTRGLRENPSPSFVLRPLSDLISEPSDTISETHRTSFTSAPTSMRWALVRLA